MMCVSFVYAIVDLLGGGDGNPLANAAARGASSGDLSTGSALSERAPERVFIVSNSLPLIMTKDEVAGRPYGHSYKFEVDGDSIYDQCREGTLVDGQFAKAINIGQLPQQVDFEEQDAVTRDLEARFNCSPVYLPDECKELFYKGFCKQYLWQLMHYVLPIEKIDKC